MSSLSDVLVEQVQAERKLSEELEKFAGEWVAVQDHCVVASAASLDALLEEIGDRDVESVFEVPEERVTACYF